MTRQERAESAALFTSIASIIIIIITRNAASSFLFIRVVLLSLCASVLNVVHVVLQIDGEIPAQLIGELVGDAASVFTAAHGVAGAQNEQT
jgi:hypothetical protein